MVGGCVTTLRLLHRRAKTFRESHNSSSRPEYLIVSLGKGKKVRSNQDRRPIYAYRLWNTLIAMESASGVLVDARATPTESEVRKSTRFGNHRDIGCPCICIISITIK